MSGLISQTGFKQFSKTFKFQLSAFNLALLFRPPEFGLSPESSGALAQLVERFNGIEEVSGSNPLCSTTLFDWVTHTIYVVSPKGVIPCQR